MSICLPCAFGIGMISQVVAILRFAGTWKYVLRLVYVLDDKSILPLFKKPFTLTDVV